MIRSRAQLYLACAVTLTLTPPAIRPAASQPAVPADDCAHQFGAIQPVQVAELSPERAAVVEEFLADFSGPALSGRTTDARELATDNSVLLLTVFSERCCSCRAEAPRLTRLAREWGHRGFSIISRSEYTGPLNARRYIREFDVFWPVLSGSPSPDPDNEELVRTSTAHYDFRTLLGSAREWGTPYSVLVVDGNFDTLYVTDGEYQPGALKAFLKKHLTPESESEPESKAE